MISNKIHTTLESRIHKHSFVLVFAIKKLCCILCFIFFRNFFFFCSVLKMYWCLAQKTKGKKVFFLVVYLTASSFWRIKDISLTQLLEQREKIIKLYSFCLSCLVGRVLFATTFFCCSISVCITKNSFFLIAKKSYKLSSDLSITTF